MNAELKKYLDTMVKEIGNKTARENARLELENHLLDEIEAMMATGLSEEESTKLVLAKATKPDKLGSKLNLAHRPFLLRYPITFAFSSLTIAAFITVVAMSNYLVQNHFLPMLKVQFDPQFETQFREDLEILKNDKTLPLAFNASKNANDFVVKQVGWSEFDKKGSYKDIIKQMTTWKFQNKFPREKDIWEIPEVVNRLRTYKPFLDLDDSWVDELHEFDHMNFLADPVNKKIFAEVSDKSGVRRIGAISSYKHPDTGTLKQAITFRALRHLFNGENKKAERLLLHGFTLFHSSKNLVGDMTASALIKTHQRLRKMFHTKWIEVPHRTRLAFRRAAWGWAAIMNRAMLDPESIKPWEAYIDPRLSVCSGVAEAQGYSGFTKDFFREKAPFETDLDELVSKSESLQYRLNVRCGHKEFITLQESEVLVKDSFFTKEYMNMVVSGDSSGFSIHAINTSRIPYVRRVMGMYWISGAVPGYYGIYLRKEVPEV